MGGRLRALAEAEADDVRDELLVMAKEGEIEELLDCSILT